MTKPLTTLRTVEDVDNAPVGTVVEPVTGMVRELVLQESFEILKNELPARVLRWGKNHYPAKFEQVIKTLADMTAEEHRLCQWMQCDVPYEGSCVILRVQDEFALVISKKGNLWDVSLSNVMPRFDLPRMVWPGEEPQEPPVVSEWVGRELRTEQDFRTAPVGTVCTNMEDDPALKTSEDCWSYIGSTSEDEHMTHEAGGPFTVIAVAES
ncbi:hypothetical protein QP992_08755 [Corynebacterium ulcerans]|uniref:hypothetical protein n=1 Tax=Corynebacterium ulcerans TaxID=65058 RepID=UPI00254F866D|nr:hypothetical protein [Corynebacterium ulcerans]MDK8889232.1 hypothetical protein [Corynebacterium ulcerans]